MPTAYPTAGYLIAPFEYFCLGTGNYWITGVGGTVYTNTYYKSAYGTCEASSVCTASADTGSAYTAYPYDLAVCSAAGAEPGVATASGTTPIILASGTTTCTKEGGSLDTNNRCNCSGYIDFRTYVPLDGVVAGVTGFVPRCITTCDGIIDIVFDGGDTYTTAAPKGAPNSANHVIKNANKVQIGSQLGCYPLLTHTCKLPGYVVDFERKKCVNVLTCGVNNVVTVSGGIWW